MTPVKLETLEPGTPFRLATIPERTGVLKKVCVGSALVDMGAGLVTISRETMVEATGELGAADTFTVKVSRSFGEVFGHTVVGYDPAKQTLTCTRAAAEALMEACARMQKDVHGAPLWHTNVASALRRKLAKVLGVA